MVKRIDNVKIGDPMGFKLLEDDTKDPDTLDKVLDALKVYHNGFYIVGKDIECGENKRPHYHIHWLSCKEVNLGALKTFRSSLGKKFSSLSKGSKLYTGQDLPSSDKNSWLGYAIKETQVKVSGYSITDEILVAGASHKQLKAMKQVRSEKLASIEKEKQEFKAVLCKYVKEELPNYVISQSMQQSGFGDHDKILLLVVKYLKENRMGSLRKGIIDGYVMYCNIMIKEWDEFQIVRNLYIR